MACESCRTQARSLARLAARASTPKAAAATSAIPFRLPAHASRAQTTRFFSSTSSRNLLKGFGTSIASSYRLLGASEQLYKVCAKPANYKITADARKKDTVERLEDGEEVGEPIDGSNVWHKSRLAS
jgi:cytochrome b pre-mRNA-processing protein 3